MDHNGLIPIRRGIPIKLRSSSPPTRPVFLKSMWLEFLTIPNEAYNAVVDKLLRKTGPEL